MTGAPRPLAHATTACCCSSCCWLLCVVPRCSRSCVACPRSARCHLCHRQCLMCCCTRASQTVAALCCSPLLLLAAARTYHRSRPHPLLSTPALATLAHAAIRRSTPSPHRCTRTLPTSLPLDAAAHAGPTRCPAPLRRQRLHSPCVRAQPRRCRPARVDRLNRPTSFPSIPTSPVVPRLPLEPLLLFSPRARRGSCPHPGLAYASLLAGYR